MSMSVGGETEEVMSTINTTPLVDVMLVMLIIFLITIPVIVPTVKVEMPEPRNISIVTKPENISVSVDVDGNVYWKGGALKSREEFLEKLLEVSQKIPQPELHLKADRNARYEHVARLLYNIQQAGMQKVSFLTEPKGRIQ
ncbi:MAG: biopolymer transporter ExbD [Steroidobacteraceae bacterium]